MIDTLRLYRLDSIKKFKTNFLKEKAFRGAHFEG